MPRTVYEYMIRNESVQAQKGKSVSRGEALGIALHDYLERHDPVRKAQRLSRKESHKENSKLSLVAPKRSTDHKNKETLTAALG